MKSLLAVCAVLFMWVSFATAETIGDTIEVSIVSDNGRLLPFYHVKDHPALKKVYAETVKGDHYRIVVRNKLNRRVGVVVAVDGRNIISGQKSWLRNHERMYILEPYATNEYSGWRSAQDTINRFYFTNVPDSYAAAFGDESAMGVIAVVAYPEKRRFWLHKDRIFSAPWKRDRSEAEGKFESRSKAAAPSAQSEAMDSAGTGYGREEYSPSYRVSFNPETACGHVAAPEVRRHVDPRSLRQPGGVIELDRVAEIGPVANRLPVTADDFDGRSGQRSLRQHERRRLGVDIGQPNGAGTSRVEAVAPRGTQGEEALLQVGRKGNRRGGQAAWRDGGEVGQDGVSPVEAGPRHDADRQAAHAIRIEARAKSGPSRCGSRRWPPRRRSGSSGWRERESPSAARPSSDPGGCPRS